MTEEHPDEYVPASDYYRSKKGINLCGLLTDISKYDVKCDPKSGDCRYCTLAMSNIMAKMMEKYNEVLLKLTDEEKVNTTITDDCSSCKHFVEVKDGTIGGTCRKSTHGPHVYRPPYTKAEDCEYWEKRY